MCEKLSALSCCDFTQELSSKAPVPGGGAAAALSGALAASLCAMAGNLTVGKKKYAAAEERLKEIIGRCEALRTRFLELIDEDAAAFLPLQRAYALPKDDPARSGILQAASLAAAQTPMQMLRCCKELSALIEEMASLCSPLVVSDAGCAASHCGCCAQSAAANVFINTAGLQAAAGLEKEAQELLACCTKRTSAVAQAVLRRIRKEE